MVDVDNLLRNVLPVVVIESNTLRPVSFRGTGFMIAPNIFVTCWQCVRDTLHETQRYAVMFKEASAYSIHNLLNIEQHSEGLDLAIAQIDLAYGHGLHICAREALPGDEVIAYGYSPGEGVFAGGQISISRLNPRLMHGHITRSFYYSCPGFVRTYTYELNMPMPSGIYGAPVIRPATNEVVGVIFAVLDILEAGRPEGIDDVISSNATREKQMMTLGIAHHTDNLRNLQGIPTSGEQVITAPDFDGDADKEFGGTIVGLRRASAASAIHKHSGFQGNIDYGSEEKIDGFYRPSSGSTFARNTGRDIRVFAGILVKLGKFTISSIRKVNRILMGIIRLRKQFDRSPENIKAREEKAKAAEMERMYRRLRRYEARLNPESLARLKEQRRIIKELELLFPTDTDSTSAY